MSSVSEKPGKLESKTQHLTTAVRGDAARRVRERVITIGLVLFVSAVGIAGVATKGRVFQPVIQFLMRLEPEGTQSRNKAVACRDPRNRNTPYCQNVARRRDSAWRSTSKEWAGSGVAFELGGN